MPQHQQIISKVPPEMDGQRLDQVVASLCPQYSRSQLQKWIKAGHIRVDDKILKPKERLTGGEEVIINAVLEPQTEFDAEAIPLDIVYEDAAIMILNKPAGLVVHPAAGNWSGTLVNALLHYNAGLEMLPRAGIVHRLDKDTTGLMVVAKTLEAHTALVAALQERDVSREYLALVHGNVVAGSTIEANIGRHPVDRKRQAVTDGGKEAITHYRIEERFTHHTLLRVSLETGRTHQIRVHLSHKHMPIVGDQVYGGRPRFPAGASETVRQTVQQFPRQALHATRLGLVHPTTGEFMQWEVPVPDDMATLFAVLRAKEIA
ncbi:MAG: rRNA pseudouridine synthase RluD [Pseudomonadota bacterium]|jgi:23S rRNA pseudouridine1911/1915/1917 synthase